MLQRPQHFTINYNHPLAQGLVFAGLGAHAGSTRYHDSSAYGNTGTLTNMDPTTDWVWDTTLNRLVIDLNGSDTDDVISCARSASAQLFTWCCWVYIRSGNNTAFLSDGNYNTDRNGVSLVSYNVAQQFRIEVADGSGYTLLDTAVGTIAPNRWIHLAVTRTDTLLQPYVGGIPSGSGAASPRSPTPAYGFTLGRHGAGASYITNCKLGDPMCYRGIITPSQIQQLADPSNVMLSGLIQPPSRKWWPVVSGAAPPASTARNLILGGGVL